jgi:hypothetical protein
MACCSSTCKLWAKLVTPEEGPMVAILRVELPVGTKASQHNSIPKKQIKSKSCGDWTAAERAHVGNKPNGLCMTIRMPRSTDVGRIGAICWRMGAVECRTATGTSKHHTRLMAPCVTDTYARHHTHHNAHGRRTMCQWPPCAPPCTVPLCGSRARAFQMPDRAFRKAVLWQHMYCHSNLAHTNKQCAWNGCVLWQEPVHACIEGTNPVTQSSAYPRMLSKRLVTQCSAMAVPWLQLHEHKLNPTCESSVAAVGPYGTMHCYNPTGSVADTTSNE